VSSKVVLAAGAVPVARTDIKGAGCSWGRLVTRSLIDRISVIATETLNESLME
jgi:hypothetical protein